MKKETYKAPITSETPALIVFILDNSSSMSDELMYNGIIQSKALLLSRIMNTTLNEIICHSKRIDGYKDYFNIIILGYSKDDVVNICKPNKNENAFITIKELVCMDINNVSYDTVRKNINGTQYSSQLSIKEFVKPTSLGKTPTGKAINVAYDLIKDWVDTHKDKNIFPPIAINISDGEFTDITNDEFLSLSEKIKSIKTSDGNLLFFNIHIASDYEAKSIIFPTSTDELQSENRHAKILFEASSVLPSCFSGDIALIKECSTKVPFKAFGYNTSINELLGILNIGSLSIIKK